MPISVVIPTFNRRERLDRVLRALADQDLDEPFEVVVVSDGSTDGTNEYLNAPGLPIAVVAEVQPNQGPAAARNRGVEIASGSLIVFLDDDVVPAPELLREHRDAHLSPGSDRLVAIGVMDDPPDHSMAPWVRWEQRMLAKQYGALNAGHYPATARQFYTGNASLMKQDFLAAGGFDPAFRRAEDIELAYRLSECGHQFEFLPRAVGYHYAERSFRSWRETAVTYGHSDVLFSRQTGREWLVGFMAGGFRRHHVAIRLLVRATCRFPAIGRAVVALGGGVMDGPIGPRSGEAGQWLLSCVFATEYHRGICEELGGWREFRHAIVAKPD